MELRLHQGDMGVVSLKEKVLLDDLKGIRIGSCGELHILAAGEVKIEGADVRLEGTEGVYLCEGEAKADEEGTVSVTVKGKMELSSDEEGSAIHSRGENVTCYLAWEIDESVKGLEKGSNNHIGDFNEGLIYLPDQKIDVEYLPGQAGMRVSRRITEEEMCYLTEEYGVEFGLVYRLGPGKNGAGGQYWLYSGDESRVLVPIGSDVIVIYHTHPKGSIGASDGDRRVMRALERSGSPQRSSQIIPVGGKGAVRFNKTGTYTPIK